MRWCWWSTTASLCWISPAFVDSGLCFPSLWLCVCVCWLFAAWHTVVRIGALDCDAEKNVPTCNRFGIDSVPNIRVRIWEGIVGVSLIFGSPMKGLTMIKPFYYVAANFRTVLFLNSFFFFKNTKLNSVLKFLQQEKVLRSGTRQEVKFGFHTL